MARSGRSRRFRSEKPVGRPTRGKTAPNRLRRVDVLVALWDPALLRRRDGSFCRAFWVDLGYGAEPFTTLETAERWHRIAPDLRGLGVEIDPERVRRAEPFADRLVDFRLGGFNLPLLPGEAVRLVRAMNVLRQYPPEAVPESLADLAVGVLPGGLLVEGTSDPSGRIWAVHLRRRTECLQGPWFGEALVLSTSFKDGFDPLRFQAVLPKDLIHQMFPGTAVHSFFAHFKEAIRDSRAWGDWGQKQWFVEAARRLANKGYSIDLRDRLLRRGYLVWRRPELDD